MAPVSVDGKIVRRRLEDVERSHVLGVALTAPDPIETWKRNATCQKKEKRTHGGRVVNGDMGEKESRGGCEERKTSEGGVQDRARREA